MLTANRVNELNNVYLRVTKIKMKWGFLLQYPINVKMAELIRPKFCVEPHVFSGKVNE